MRRRGFESAVLLVWSLVLAAVVLGPALAPGLVLLRDMVWVPDLRLSGDALGLGSGLPRAVPSDAVVAVLDEVVPGGLLQRVVLLSGLAGGGLAVARLLGPDAGLPARLVAVSLYGWNAWVLERLLMGQWPVLVGCAVLPWVVLTGRSWVEQGRLPVALLVLAPLGSLSASAGFATAVALVLSLLDGGRRRLAGGVVLLVAANAPWVVSGLLHVGSATSDPRAAGLFALHAEGDVPAPLAALTLGGIWNADVVPAERTGALGWTTLVVVGVLAVLGCGTWWRRTAAPLRTALIGCWCVGAGLALLTWAAPGAVGWVAGRVPGAGILRDGARVLVLCAPLLAVLTATGADVLLRRVRAPAPARLALAVGAVLAPLALLPSLAWGAAGQLRPVTYPPAYATAREVTAGLAGDVLVLPLSSYRAPSWNGGRPVLDPLARYLARGPGSSVVTSDVLVVDGVTLAGEDRRVATAERALAAPSPAQRASALADLGVGVVVTDLSAPGADRVPPVAGQVLLDGAGTSAAPSPGLRVVALDGARTRTAPTSWVAATSLAWAAFVAPLVAAPLVAVRRRTRALRGPRGLPRDAGR